MSLHEAMQQDHLSRREQYLNRGRCIAAWRLAGWYLGACCDTFLLLDVLLRGVSLSGTFLLADASHISPVRRLTS
jgi:hypothetical protein